MAKRINKTAEWLRNLADDAIMASRENAWCTAGKLGDMHPEFDNWVYSGIEDHIYNGDNRAPEDLAKRCYAMALHMVNRHPVQIAKRKAAEVASVKAAKLATRRTKYAAKKGIK